jgi:hypothetical protein
MAVAWVRAKETLFPSLDRWTTLERLDFLAT